MGIDIVDLEESRSELNESLMGTPYLPDEVRYAETQARSWESYGVRLAAKRAFFRALGEDPPDADGLRKVEVLRQDSGELDLRPSGRALDASRAAGADSWQVSVSHTRHTALAVVVLVRRGPDADPGAD